jgi:predicted RNA-binding Zn ribbon-like protein
VTAFDYTKMAEHRHHSFLDVTTKNYLNSYMKERYDYRLPNRAGSLHLLGGNLALNFANTESGRNGPQHLNHIQSAADIATWARHAEVIDEPVAIKESDLRLFTEGQALRRAIYEINSALAAGKSPPPASTQSLARAHGKTLQSAILTARDGKYLWTWEPTEELVDAILGPIAQAAVTLLTQQDHSRIKQCKGNHCGWLFYDATKNNSRRWCDMSVCGNRSKIKALRKRREKPEHPA